MDREFAIAAAAGRFHLYDSDDSEPDESNDITSGLSATGAHGGGNGSAMAAATVWVFGYGSLCWNPGFAYTKCVIGYIRGYVRRFWQGNDAHRGNKEQPGRVATLIEEPQGITWGCAYKLCGPSALDYLRQRECTLGGYITEYTKFYPRHANDEDDHVYADADTCGTAFPALLYVATEANRHWLGECDATSIARQITISSGPSGHNVEYLLRLAAFMRDEVGGAEDDHLFELERLVLRLLADQKVAVSPLMGAQPQPVHRNTYEDAVRRPRSFEYRSRVPDVKLRCLHI